MNSQCLVELTYNSHFNNECTGYKRNVPIKFSVLNKPAPPRPPHEVYHFLNISCTLKVVTFYVILANGERISYTPLKHVATPYYDESSDTFTYEFHWIQTIVAAETAANWCMGLSV